MQSSSKVTHEHKEEIYSTSHINKTLYKHLYKEIDSLHKDIKKILEEEKVPLEKHQEIIDLNINHFKCIKHIIESIVLSDSKSNILDKFKNISTQINSYSKSISAIGDFPTIDDRISELPLIEDIFEEYSMKYNAFEKKLARESIELQNANVQNAELQRQIEIQSTALQSQLELMAKLEDIESNPELGQMAEFIISLLNKQTTTESQLKIVSLYTELFQKAKLYLSTTHASLEMKKDISTFLENFKHQFSLITPSMERLTRDKMMFIIAEFPLIKKVLNDIHTRLTADIKNVVNKISEAENKDNLVNSSEVSSNLAKLSI